MSFISWSTQGVLNSSLTAWNNRHNLQTESKTREKARPLVCWLYCDCAWIVEILRSYIFHSVVYLMLQLLLHIQEVRNLILDYPYSWQPQNINLDKGGGGSVESKWRRLIWEKCGSSAVTVIYYRRISWYISQQQNHRLVQKQTRWNIREII